MEALLRFLWQLVRGADKTTPDGQTVTIIAAQEGHLSIVQYLVQQGADKNKATPEGVTPLFVAIHQDRTAVVNYLREQGAIWRIGEPPNSSLPTVRYRDDDRDNV